MAVGNGSAIDADISDGAAASGGQSAPPTMAAPPSAQSPSPSVTVVPGSPAPTTSPSGAAIARMKTSLDWLEAHNLLDDATERFVALVYDEDLQLHIGPLNHPEQPSRVRQIWSQFETAGLLRATQRAQSREATEEELCLVHSPSHVEKVLRYDAGANRRKPKAFTFPFGPDTYVCEQTPHCAKLSTGCLLSLVDDCFNMSSPANCGMAVIRPPGHHATADRASGFCLFNNVAVAARHAQQRHGAERVAIVDWDVHHGNGTSDIFAEDDSVLFFSVHRFDTQGFFPGTGMMEDAGKTKARGYTANVPLDKGYGDWDLRHVLRYVLCPLLEQFKPDIIFISAGFDAVRGDPLGECRVSPEGYGWMTRCLHRLAKHYCHGRLILALEGGYNPDMIAQSSVECVLSLISETVGIAGPWTDAYDAVACPSRQSSFPVTPASSLPGTPSMPSTPVATSVKPPQQSSNAAAAVQLLIEQGALPSHSDHEGLRGNSLGPSVHSTPPMSPAGSQKCSRPKAREPTSKTVRVVRQITEIHNVLPLAVPLAPKADGGGGGGAKNSRKNERRKQMRRSGSESHDDVSSDSSGWAIACAGNSDSEPPSLSPHVRNIRAVSMSEGLANLPLLELPPSSAEHASGGDAGGTSASGDGLRAACDSDEGGANEPSPFSVLHAAADALGNSKDAVKANEVSSSTVVTASPSTRPVASGAGADSGGGYQKGGGSGGRGGHRNRKGKRK
eukprot:TRINITY_DN38608_c0_g1_i1.p1 TRINITY_DN38608_c0_g1~~TRINITY_DN38608_c0_g1_i1.p1  ORF type:complete len:730 (-),score=116.51 TRINITY_DN38608_c0_g1_i1:108-2297(-)